MSKVRFTADYDHRWPSRARTAFRKGWEGRVKREVADAAIAAGKAELIEPDAPEGDAAASQ